VSDRSSGPPGSGNSTDQFAHAGAVAAIAPKMLDALIKWRRLVARRRALAANMAIGLRVTQRRQHGRIGGTWLSLFMSVGLQIAYAAP
jgi:hypothetical protein